MTPTYTLLISPEELQPHLAASGWVVFDCRHALRDPESGARAYREAHIPGARFAHLERDLSGKVGPGTGRHPLRDIGAFCAWLAAQGVNPASQVVAYDADQGAFAARLWWMLRSLGHPHVAVLDGGLARWRREGRATDNQVPLPRLGTFDGSPNPRMVAELPEVEALSRASEGVLFDARGAERYRGESEPIDPKPGHIPGAANLPFTGNLRPDGAFLPAAALKERFRAALGGVPSGKTVHYCGSGVSACHNLLALAVAGLEPGRLYVGSWSQWCQDPRRAVATGPAPR